MKRLLTLLAACIFMCASTAYAQDERPPHPVMGQLKSHNIFYNKELDYWEIHGEYEYGHIHFSTPDECDHEDFFSISGVIAARHILTNLQFDEQGTWPIRKQYYMYKHSWDIFSFYYGGPVDF